MSEFRRWSNMLQDGWHVGMISDSGRSGIVHGEYVRYNKTQDILEHNYQQDGKVVINFLAVPFPIDNEERVLIILKHGGAFLPDSCTKRN